MKRIISILLICLTCALASPNANALGKPKTNQQKPEPKIEWNDSIETEINKLSSKVDTINSSKLTVINESIKGKQDKFPGWLMFLFWGSLSLNITAFALISYLLMKLSDLKDIKGRLDKYKETLNHDKATYNRYTLDVQNALKTLHKEIEELKQRTNNTQRMPRTYPSNAGKYVSGGPFQIENTPVEETVYFAEVIGDNGQFYFNKTLPSRSGAIFKATKRGNQAEFEPLGLDVLWGNDNARKVIDFSGVATQNAQQMQILSKGIAVFNDGYWDVQRNANVNLV